MAVRFIMEVAWQAHFVTNMFIAPTEEEIKEFKPDFVVYNASKAKVENYKELGLNSETAVVFNTTSREQVIINTWYGGEMKKGMFSMMNYYLPQKGIASMHCSANTDKEGKNTAIFFGLSRHRQDNPFYRPQASSLSVTTSTDGTTTVCSTSRVAAMPRLSTSTRRANPISSTPSHATPSSRTLPLTQKARLTSRTRALPRILV